MILSDVRRYLADKGQVTLADVALHFDIEPDAARGMLDVWVRKGKASNRMVSTSCGSCSQCDPTTTEVYIWGDASDHPGRQSKCSY